MNVQLGTIYLAGPGQSEATQRTRFDPDFLVQWQEFFRGETATPLDRGNDRVLLSFEVDRAYADVATAENAVLQHHVAIRAATPDTVTVTSVQPNGNQAYLYIPAAVVKMRVLGYIGLLTRFAYEILGGKVQTTRP